MEQEIFNDEPCKSLELCNNDSFYYYSYECNVKTQIA